MFERKRSRKKKAVRPNTFFYFHSSSDKTWENFCLLFTENVPENLLKGFSRDVDSAAFSCNPMKTSSSYYR